MNLSQKNRILSFVEEIDSLNLSKYVFNSNYANIDGFESRVIQIYECLFKNVFLPVNYKYKKPNFHTLLTSRDREIFKVRNNILKLDSHDCDFLLKIAQYTRNPLEHGTYKKSDDSLKEKLAEILFCSLKNAYEYKTNNSLDVSFSDFLESLKYSKEQQLEKSNKELKQSNEEKDKIIAELNEKLSLSINKVEIISVKPKKRATKVVEKKELKIEKEIKYSKIQKNDKYIIPKELGQDTVAPHSSHIDIAFDFLEKGWFEEAKKEILGSTHPLTSYVLFLANNNLKNINDLISSSNYELLLSDLIKLLSELPVKNVREITSQLIVAFCSIGPKDTKKKIDVFASLISMTTSNENNFKDNFFEYLLKSESEFEVLRGGFDLYFSSFKDSEYGASIIKAFETMLKRHQFNLMFNVKEVVLYNIEDPTIIRMMFMAQARAESFDKVFIGLDGVFNSSYLSPLLNYDFYNDKKEFETLKGWIIRSIKNSSKLIGVHKETNAIVLLNCISQYLDEKEYCSLIDLLVDLFKTEQVWTSHTKECLLLIDLLRNKPSTISEMINCWVKSSKDNRFDFYKEAVSKATKYCLDDDTLLKINILLSLSLNYNYKPFSKNPKGISSIQIENYLKLSDDYEFIDHLLTAIVREANEINIIVYSNAFEILLPYFKGNEKDTFEKIKGLASKLVEASKFDIAEKFYRYMLSLNINSSVCYWGLLFCEYKVSNIEQLSNVENLYDNEKFQATLHSSKEESPEIYKKCLDVYSSHKVNKANRIKEAKNKRERRLSFIVALSQVISMFAFAAVGFLNAAVMWPFFIVAAIILVSIILYQNVLVYPPKRNLISGIVILCAEVISWSVLAGVHIGRAAMAATHYNELSNMMMDVRYELDAYLIKKKIREIPYTYRNIGSIKNELKDLEWAFNRPYGREEFSKVNNFSVNHSNWDCSAFLYDYNFKSLFFGANWKVDGTSETLYYYRDSSKNERFSAPSSILPNDMQLGKDYYFYDEYDYLNDKDALVNQYMKIGFVNKNDPSDKFLAYEFSCYHFNKDGQIRIEVFCYSDSSNHYLIYDAEHYRYI